MSLFFKSGRRGWHALAVVALCGALSPFLDLAPADAHPFGPPQVASVDLAAGRADAVRVRWRLGAADDLTLLGVRLGLLPADRVMLDGAVATEATDVALVTESPEFARYVTDSVRVESGGRRCAAELTPDAGETMSGRWGPVVTTVHTCAGFPADPVVAISTMLDLDPGYRTLATGPGGQRAVYSASETAHTWHFGSAAEGSTGALSGQSSAHSSGRDAAIQLGAVGALVLAGGGLVLRRRRSHRAG